MAETKGTRRKTTKIGRVVGVNVVVLVTVFLLLEWGLKTIYHNPPNRPRGIVRGFRHYYMNHGRKVLQWQEGSTRYDQELSYTLRPGQFVFSNVEYTVVYEVNSLGLRDDEISLQAPDVVVVGDSHAMGYGVYQEESFPELIEKSTGLRVLNAAIASYGTAREMKILERVDLSNLKYLIVQYCQNDYGENRTLFENGNVLPIMSETESEKVIRWHRATWEYYFGKYVQYLLPSLVRHQVKEMLKPYFFEEEKPEEHEDEVFLFLNALLHNGIDLENIKIVVLEINSYAANDDVFLTKLRREVSEGSFPTAIKNIILVDLSEIVNDGHYYLLDDHMNRTGHQVVAEILARMIQGVENHRPVRGKE